MKAMTKILKIVVVAVVVLIVVLYLLSGYLLRIGVEKGGTAALGVGVKVKDIDISLLRGMVGIDGLQVANPAGYSHEYLLELGRGKVVASIPSFLSDTVRIKELNLDDINLVVEQKGLSSNLQDIINSISAKGAKDAGKTKEKEEKKAESAGKNLVIGRLEITNVKVKVKLLPTAGKSGTVELQLAPIRMNNLGTDSKMSMARLSEKILHALAKGVAKQGAGLLPDDVVGGMQSALDKAAVWGEGASDEDKKVIEKGADIVEGFKGLLKPKK